MMIMMMPLIMMMMTMQEHDDYYEGVQVTEDTLPMDNYHCNIGKLKKLLKVGNFERAYFSAVFLCAENTHNFAQCSIPENL